MQFYVIILFLFCNFTPWFWLLKAKGWKEKALLSPSCTVKMPDEFGCTQLLLYKGTPSLSHRLLQRRCHCLQSHALSTPAQHRPWAPLSVPSSWRLPPWETQMLYKMLLFRSLDEIPLPVFGALLSKAKENVLELLFPPISALVLLLSEGVSGKRCFVRTVGMKIRGMWNTSGTPQ